MLTCTCQQALQTIKKPRCSNCQVCWSCLKGIDHAALAVFVVYAFQQPSTDLLRRQFTAPAPLYKAEQTDWSFMSQGHPRLFMVVNPAGDEEAEQLEFRIIDYGHARLAKNKALAKLPKAPGLELSYRK